MCWYTERLLIFQPLGIDFPQLYGTAQGGTCDLNIQSSPGVLLSLKTTVISLEEGKAFILDF